MVFKPPETVTKPLDMAIKPPTTAIKPTENSSPLTTQSQQLGQQAPIEQSVLLDPEIQACSWVPSPNFHSFLEEHFRKKLTLEQVCDILEEQAVPAVDALSAPTLDLSVINQIPVQNKKLFRIEIRN